MNVTDKAAGTRDWSVRMRGCKRRRKDRKQTNKQKKLRAPTLTAIIDMGERG